jgi:putative addiction module component (TIGR02574 family)
MASSLLQSALKLSKSERILLVEEIWNSLADTQDAADLSGAQTKELDRRLARLKQTGPLGSSWGDVKKRLRKR